VTTPPKAKSGVVAYRAGTELTLQAVDERERHEMLHSHAVALLPKYGPEWNLHSQVVMRRQTLSRILYYTDLYRQVISVPGVICEFGVQWGATLATLINLRGMFEPFNHSRRIFGFDTFAGFAVVDKKDGGHSSVGDYRTMENYERTLEEILALQESFSPLSHIRKFELIKGDASQTIDTWLDNNPHAIVSMAIFDMDVYLPTRDVLKKIIPRLTRGSLLVFDELNCAHFPGETAAVQEVLGLNNVALKHHPHQPFCAWAVWGA
jgi:Macrocin-O-methyltransferase (TylF)